MSFRLSEAEYNSLKNISETRGARNVSEFTRSAAFQMDDGNTDEDMDKIESALSRLKDTVELLDNAIQKLATVFEIQAKQKSSMDSMNPRKEEPPA